MSQPSKSEPMKRFDLPSLPWQDTATAFLGPMPGGECILAIVDYFSRFFEVDILKSTTSEELMKHLDQMFVCHGFPISINMDSGR